jgi:glycogen operon protein
VHRFVSLLLARRSLREIAAENARVSLTQLLRDGRWAWHGVRLNRPDWGGRSHSIAYSVEVPREGLWFHMMFNAYWEALEFELPAVGGARWRRWIDTSLEAPQDIAPWRAAPPVPGDRYRVGPRAVAVLYAAAG